MGQRVKIPNGSPARTGRRPTKGCFVIILGVVLLVIGLVASIPVLVTVGSILLLIGVIFWVLGSMGRAVGGRKHYY